MFEIVTKYLAVLSPLIALGVLLNKIAPPAYSRSVATYFASRSWTLSETTSAFITNTFFQLFGERLVSWRFFIASIIVSLAGLLFFSLVFYLANDVALCRYPIDWCSGFDKRTLRELLLLLFAVFVIDIISFAQTSLIIRFAMNAKQLVELTFLAYADVVLTVALFTFVMPGFLVLAIVMTPPEERKVEVYARVVIPQPAHTVDMNSIAGKSSKGVSQSRKSAASQSKAERARNPASVEDDLNVGEQDDELDKAAKQSQLSEIQIEFFYNDGKPKLPLVTVLHGYAKGKAIQIENALLASIRESNQVVEMREREIDFSDVPRAKLIFTETVMPLANASSLYSALYGEVIRFNQAFWEFLLGSPVFIEANKTPIYSNTSGQEPVETYLCFGGGKTYATQNAFRCLSNETFVIVRSADFLQVGAAYALNRLAERNISLSVFFATSMTVTVMFYLGLLLYLVPAYLFRRGTSEVIRLFGKTGQANSISIAIAIGALPVAAILVTLARLI